MARTFLLDGQSGISTLLGLSADEFALFPTSDMLFNAAYSNTLTSTVAPNFWPKFYNYIYQTNRAIESISKSEGMTMEIKKQLTGEAKFMRGFCYFYLLNIFGEVPIATTPDYQVNSKLTRSPVSEVI